LNLYQRFKWLVVSELPHREWILTSDQVEQSVQELREADQLMEDLS